MKNKYVDIESISDLHNFYGHSKPKHPLISIIDLKEIDANNRPKDSTLYRLGFYTIFFKTNRGVLKYGKSNYDFDEGSLIFTAPYQVISTSPTLQFDEGWGFFFHPDLLNTSALGKKISSYSFFSYDSNEALHISEDEKQIIKECIGNIKREYSQNIDKHTERLIQSNIELFLNYCNRFYDRQFFTRSPVNNDIVQRFEKTLKDYFSQDTLIEAGLPDVKYLASRLNLSPNYLSDLLNKYTGKTTQEHIHLQLIDKAKVLLCSTDKSVSEIAYELGFDYPSHFTKIFKRKTNLTPIQFKRSFN